VFFISGIHSSHDSASAADVVPVVEGLDALDDGARMVGHLNEVKGGGLSDDCE